MQQLIKTGMTEPGILVINGYDGDEDILNGYMDIELPSNWESQLCGNNIGCNAPLNNVFKQFPNEPYYAAIDDDEWVETEGWDKKLVAAAGKWDIANANSDMHRIQGFVTIGGDLVRCVGWHVLPGLFHWYGEQVWEELHKFCNLRVWCKSIKAEHRHWSNGKALLDDTYRSQDPNIAKDREIFEKWMAQECHHLAAKINKERENARIG